MYIDFIICLIIILIICLVFFNKKETFITRNECINQNGSIVENNLVNTYKNKNCKQQIDYTTKFCCIDNYNYYDNKVDQPYEIED